ncbi:MAG TPA: hypothetical protein DCW45_03485 [Opitutae bacterium]|nr:hypothetical protein [Opitutae bacterium]
MKNLLLSRPFKVLIFLSIAFFFSNCAKNKVHSTSKENPDDQSLEPVMKRVKFQGDLRDVLIVAGVKQSKVNEDLLKVEVRLQNLKEREINLSYKIEWLDQDGIMVSDSSLVWFPLLIKGGESVAVQTVSTTTKAKNFHLKVQRAKNP